MLFTLRLLCSTADLATATQMFGRDAKCGAAASGTGPNMSPRSNLAEHLIEALNVICGRYARAGDPLANWGALSPPGPVVAQVVPPTRPWMEGPRSKIRDCGTQYGERMAAILADEILEPGPDQIRALISAGGNPASALPDQRKAVAALQSLDLLVAVEPFMSTTARLADYILPTKLLHERADLPPTGYYERALYHRPFAQLALPLVTPPQGSDVADDWYIYWSLTKRLGHVLEIAGVPMDMATTPTTVDLMRAMLKDARVSFDELRQSPDGVLPPETGQVVEAAGVDATGRFSLFPVDVAEEFAAAAAEAEAATNSEFPFLLTVRRLREVVNTTGHGLPNVQRRKPYNAAYMNPDDLSAAGLQSGGRANLRSDYTELAVIVEADNTMRRGVISMSHGWGGLPDESDDPSKGVCTNLLVRTDKRVESINAMPTMSAIPVAVSPLC